MVMATFNFVMLKCNGLALQLAELKASRTVSLKDSLVGSVIKSSSLSVIRYDLLSFHESI